MTRTNRDAIKRDLRTFGIGAACGFLGGVLLTWAVITQYGDTIRSRIPSVTRNDGVPAATDRWKDAVDGTGVVKPSQRPVSTTGATTREPSIAPPPESTAELRTRRLEIPIPGVRPDQLTSHFQDSRNGRQHEALDILAPRNTAIRAIEDGKIVRLFLSKAGGTTIYQFDPSERYCYYYAHLERYADGLREGQLVRRGEVIGFVGTSGNAPKDVPHLHFAIFRLTPDKHWWEGTPIDPYEVLR